VTEGTYRQAVQPLKDKLDGRGNEEVEMTPLVEAKTLQKKLKQPTDERTVWHHVCIAVYAVLILILIVLFVMSNISGGLTVKPAVVESAWSKSVLALNLTETELNLELTMDKFKVPTERTYYECKTFDLPTDSVRHVTSFEPIIEPKNADIVHHVLLYICSTRQPRKTFECAKMPNGCESILASWAMGAPPFYHPDVAGFKIGRATDSIHVVLQMHYDNWDNRDNAVDSSGFMLRTTEKLRQYDAGLLVVGAILERLTLPPGIPQYGLENKCTENRVAKFLGEESSVNVYAYGVHAHKLGTAIWTDHHRPGANFQSAVPNVYRNSSAEWEVAGRNMMYDFNFQSFVKYDESEYKTIKKGDHLITSCIYDTTSRSTITHGGEGSNDEMCLNFFMYYPKTKAAVNDAGLGWCLTVPNPLTPAQVALSKY
jgi:hypothetical protein